MHTETNINSLLMSKVTFVSKVRETIYILGLGMPGLRPPTEGEEPPPVLMVRHHNSIIIHSIIFFDQSI